MEKVRIGLQEPDWEYIGAVLSREDCETQAMFFKSFVRECLSWGTTYQVSLQLAYVNGRLSDKEKETLEMLSYRK